VGSNARAHAFDWSGGSPNIDADVVTVRQMICRNLAEPSPFTATGTAA
jgi:hypothetical protein